MDVPNQCSEAVSNKLKQKEAEPYSSASLFIFPHRRTGRFNVSY